jgi:hypothetical protein
MVNLNGMKNVKIITFCYLITPNLSSYWVLNNAIPSTEVM